MSTSLLENIPKTIPIRNVYFLLAYAFNFLRVGELKNLNFDEFADAKDLLAEILIIQVNKLVKQGLTHDYVPRCEELAGVRGKIDISESIKRQTFHQARLICIFDEFTEDILMNRIIKTTLEILKKTSLEDDYLRKTAEDTNAEKQLDSSEQLDSGQQVNVGENYIKRKSALNYLLRHFASVSLIQPNEIAWGSLKFHRNNKPYQFLINLCRLIIDNYVFSHQTGNKRYRTLDGDLKFSALFERFLLNYYSYHYYPKLHVFSNQIKWNATPGKRKGQLPRMKTDVVITNELNALIIDAKCYRNSLDNNYGKKIVKSGHIYQIYSYVKNYDTARSGNVSGLLLYAKTNDDEHANLDCIIDGNRIGAQTLDLTLEWLALRQRLDEILIQWLPSC